MRRKTTKRHMESPVRFGPPGGEVTQREFVELQQQAAGGDTAAAHQVGAINRHMVALARQMTGKRSQADG
jgi:hypothetical protein